MSDTPEPPAIDAHAHVFTRAMPVTDTAWTRPTYDYPVEAYLAELDAHGIAFGVVTAASLFGDYNDYTLAVLKRHKRLRATVILDPDVSAAELAALKDAGVCGTRFQLPPGTALPDVAGYRFRRFLTRLADAGLHLELNLDGAQLAQLLPALAAYDLRVAIDHFGLLRSEGETGGAGFQALLRATENGRTFTKVSAGFRLPEDRLADYAARLLSVAGADRLFWGSDAPFVGAEARVSYGQTLDTFYRIVPDPRDRRRMSDAALRFFFF